MAGGCRAAAPAAQDEAGGTARLAGELQPAAGGRRERADFAEHRGKSAAPQPLLHRPENILVVATAREDQALRRKPVASKAWRVEIVAAEAPEHRRLGTAREPGEDAGDEGGRDGAILLVRPRPHHLMQRAEREAAAGERRIERRAIERQNRRCRAAAFERANTLPQNGEVGFYPVLLHSADHVSTNSR